MPMKPLCKTECAGLCDTCGKDLNQVNAVADRNKPTPLGGIAKIEK